MAGDSTFPLCDLWSFLTILMLIMVDEIPELKKHLSTGSKSPKLNQLIKHHAMKAYGGV
jgi:hypothetical protein